MAVESVRFAINSHHEKAEISLATFMNNSVASDEASNQINFELYKPSEDNVRNKQKRMLVASTDRMDYLGFNTGYTAMKAPTYAQYYVCIFDKRKRKMRIINKSPTWYQMRPRCCTSELGTEDNVDGAEKTFSEKVDNLTSAFGSSKSKRAMASRKKNKVTGQSLENSVGTAVDAAVGSMDVTDLAAAPQQDSAGEIPPYNKDATEPRDVYKLDDIISAVEMEAMRGPATVFVNATRDQLQQWHTEQRYAEYILKQLSSLPVKPDAREQRAVCLAYLNYLMAMYQYKAADLKRKDPFPADMPAIIKKTLTSKFLLVTTTSKGQQIKCIPLRLKDKLASYILVLCLILDEFQLECDVLMKDLKIGLTKLITYLRALGCRVNSKKSTTLSKTACHTATLPIPLTFPTLTAKTKKDRR